MKKLTVSFRTQLVGLMEFEVSDDFNLKGKQADEIWEDLCENYPDQIEFDIMNNQLPDLLGIDLGGFTADYMDFDCIESFCIQDNDGKTIEEEDYIDNSPLSLE